MFERHLQRRYTGNPSSVNAQTLQCKKLLDYKNLYRNYPNYRGVTRLSTEYTKESDILTEIDTPPTDLSLYLVFLPCPSQRSITPIGDLMLSCTLCNQRIKYVQIHHKLFQHKILGTLVIVPGGKTPYNLQRKLLATPCQNF